MGPGLRRPCGRAAMCCEFLSACAVIALLGVAGLALPARGADSATARCDASVPGRTQRVRAAPSRLVVQQGAVFRVRVDYDVPCAAADDAIAGLGLRLHFDSQALDLVHIDSVHATARIGADRAPRPDTADADGDRQTDRVLQFAWAAVDGNWPAGRSGPTALLELVFTAGRRPGPTVLRITSSGVAPDAVFVAEPLHVDVREGMSMCEKAHPSPSCERTLHGERCARGGAIARSGSVLALGSAVSRWASTGRRARQFAQALSRLSCPG